MMTWKKSRGSLTRCDFVQGHLPAAMIFSVKRKMIILSHGCPSIVNINWQIVSR